MGIAIRNITKWLLTCYRILSVLKRAEEYHLNFCKGVVIFFFLLFAQQLGQSMAFARAIVFLWVMSCLLFVRSVKGNIFFFHFVEFLI